MYSTNKQILQKRVETYYEIFFKKSNPVIQCKLKRIAFVFKIEFTFSLIKKKQNYFITCLPNYNELPYYITSSTF